MNVNAPDNIRKFNFYQQYVWQHTDFTNFQSWVLAMFRSVFEGAFGSCVLGGFEPLVAGGMNVAIRKGIAVNENGKQLILNADSQVTLASNGANPMRSLVVIRPVETSMTNVTDPLNPPTQVPLHVKEEYELVVIPGVPGVNPIYPAKNAGDVILFGVKLATAQVALTISDLDFSVKEYPRDRQPKIRQVAANYSAQPDDEIIEVSCSGGNVTITLPVAASANTRKLTCVKIDNSANEMILSGQGGEQISGLATVPIDTQWDFVNAYSNGINGWRRF